MKTCGYPDCSPCHDPKYEHQEITFAARWLSRESRGRRLTGRFIDVGAHVGLWSLAIYGTYSRLRIRPDIFAFEPDAKNYRALRTNFAELKGMTSRRLAAWKEPANLILSPNPHPARRQVSIAGAGTIIEAVTLDSICGNLIIDLIKIDVEGVEFEVLQGAERLLTQPGRRLLMMEWCVSRNNFQAAAVVQFLNRSGYEWISRNRRPLLKRQPMSISVEAFQKSE